MNGLTEGGDWRVIAATLVLGLTCGALAWAAGVPLGMMLGAMIGTGLASAFGLRVFGALPMVPQSWRLGLVPVIGVAIGARFPPDILDQIARWWITLVVLCLFIPLVHIVSAVMFRRIGRLDRQTAWYGAMPGGLVEAVMLGEKSGADAQMLMLLQFLRLILTVLAVPLAFSVVFGIGERIAPTAAAVPIGGADAALLLGSAVGGWWLADRLKLPAPMLVGPLALSAIVHATGMTAAVPPGWMVLSVQWIMGTSLGARFAGLTGAKVWLSLRLAAANMVLMLVLASGIAVVCADLVAEPISAVILAFAPGGVSEMALLALSMELSVVYVTLHHVARIMVAILFARAASDWLAR